MSKIVKVADSEYLEVADYTRLATDPRDAIDALVGGAVGYPAHWSAFTIAKKSAQQITVSPGRYLESSMIYAADAAQDINLTLYFPLAASDEKWVAIIARGATVSINENRAFETSTDPQISVPVEVSSPVIEARTVTYTVQQGLASPAPALKPTISSTDACLAFVRVTTSGIQEIVPGEHWRAKTLYEVEGRVTAIELRVTQLFEDTSSIRTDVANLAASIKSIPDPRLVAQVIRDTARHSQLLNLPDEARNYFYDGGLVKDFWDFAAGGYFRVNEGIRFQYAAQYDHVLRLQNYDDPALSIWDNRIVLPKYEKVVQITSPEGTGRLDVSNVVHTVTTAVQHTVSHERIRYGETINVCENTAGWGGIGAAKAGEIYKSAGEEWISGGATANPWNNTETAQNGHTEYAAQRIIRDTYQETYTTYNTEEFGLSGAIHGNTFLCSQPGYIVAIDLNFTKVDATSINGGVTLCLCKTNSVGAPDLTAVLARVTKPQNALTLGWCEFLTPPTLPEQGERYGWFIVTSGNHQLMTNSGNAYAGGTQFVCTDGIWAQALTSGDITFRVKTAKFAANRTVVPFESLGLTGGMTEIEMVYKRMSPAATAMVWEVKAQGDTEWVPMDARTDNPLANLPPLVQVRAVFIGTQDVAPAIVLDAYARAVTGRMRLDQVAIAKLKTFGFATTQAQIVLNMDNYNSAIHTAVPKVVLAGGTVVSPSSIVATIDPAKPKRTKIVANFTLPGGTTQGRARFDATTTSVIDVPFGQDIQLNAF